MPRDVRTHTRTDPRTGRQVRVQHHTRRGSRALKDRRGPNPNHARRLGRKARAAGRRGLKGRAAMLGVLALGEIAAWLTLSGTSLILALAAGVLAALSIALVK